MSTNDPAKLAQTKDLLEVMHDFDPELFRVLCDQQVYTARGRLNLSKVGRLLGANGYVTHARMEALREYVGGNVGAKYTSLVEARPYERKLHPLNQP